MSEDASQPGASDPDTDREAGSRSDFARRAAQHVEREKQELRQTWLDSGGDEAEFESAWPAIRAQLGKARLYELGEKARRRSLSRFHKPP